MPHLSAILVMPLDYVSIRKTIRHLCAQTAKDRMELVIVTTPGKEALIPAAELASLSHWRVIAIPEIETGADGWAAGIAAASGEIVVLTEDHSYPEPDWAEALIEAHNGEYAAVAPSIHNGNPATLTSWANFLLCFLEWFAPASATTIASGPGHNTSYKREALSMYSDELAAWLRSERLLHMDFEKNGRRMFLDPRSATHHVNISRLGSYLRHSWYGGRLFGAGRRVGWPLWKRAAYAAAFWLTPAVRLKRILSALNNREKRRAARFWSALPLIGLGLFAHAAGEAAGYLFGAGDSFRAYSDFEMRRADHVISSERELLRAQS